LDSNAEKIFLRNISDNQKSSNGSSKGSKTKNQRKNSKLSDYLKNGFLDFSLDSNSVLSKEEQAINKDENNKKHKKNKNFILKSELFSSFESDKKKESEKLTPKPPILS
jgi:hypothetical protein